MSRSFTFSANAEPFFPKGVESGKTREEILQGKIDTLQADIENEKITNMKLMKLYKGQCSKVQEHSEERLESLTSENERLNKEIRQINTRLLESRVDNRELNEKIQRMQAHINNLNADLSYKDDRYDTLHHRFDNLNREFTQYKERGDPETWMGRCLKLDFIFKKMKQIGALPEDHGAWVWDMVEDIEFPENQSVSVFLSVPSSIRNRYLPSFDDAGINFQSGEDSIINDLGLSEESIAIRSTGCPNGCGRPYLGEIGLVGKAPGKYNLYLGAKLNGTRLNKLYMEAIGHEEIIESLRPIFLDYAKNRGEGEQFGDFCIRTGLVKATGQGPDFHD